MKTVLLALFIAGLCGALPESPGSLKATTVLIWTMDCNDTLGPGGGLWQSSYAVSGFTFPQDYGSSLSSAADLSSHREHIRPVVNTDGDGLTIQSDALLCDASLYDALVAVDVTGG